MSTHQNAEYIFLTDRTRGQFGKPIKVHIDVAMYLYCTVEADSYLQHKIIQDLHTLRTFIDASAVRNVPEHHRASDKEKARRKQINNTLSSMVQARHMQGSSWSSDHMRAFYHLEQKAGDKCPTVYISEIRLIKQGYGEQAGLYETSKGSRRSAVAKMKSRKLDNRTVFVSRATKDVKTAMTTAKETLGDDTVVFYNPSEVANDIGIWGGKKLSPQTQQAVDEMKLTLQENQRSAVAWLVEGEGAGVLRHALEGTPLNLEKHSFKLLNSRTKTPELLKLLASKRAQVNGDVVEYNLHDKQAMLGLAAQLDALNEQIGQLPGYHDYAIISRRYLMHNLSSKGSLNAQVAAKLTNSSSANANLVDLLKKA